MFGAVGNQDVFDRSRTFKTTLTRADVGKAVTMIGNNEVGLGSDGNVFVGRLGRVEKDGTCRVECFGNVEVPSTGAIAVGQQVVVDGKGKVKAAGAEGNGRGFVSVVDAASGKVQVEL
ncbi:hypothetical protein [Brevibacillus borstelensis]|uniref:hypothetical protein n=1 Tax=Brevibacillus borstelensis TaxID=45462 RepID=UPI0004F2878C|nr:hypothetical protein [Brevibacillus borstelensis]KKX52483.1 hypothetical protein X546_25065 [Brevibacillus borstelensis cifa_chp40]